MKKEKNELMIVNDIDKRLKEENEVKVFPLTPTHRRELRDLKEKNIGNLRETLRNIRHLKREEYIIKYSEEIKKEFILIEEHCNVLNNDWIEVKNKIGQILKTRKEYEERVKLKIGENFSLSSDYNELGRLKLDEIGESKRKFYINQDKVSKDIAESEFNEKYGKSFEMVESKIDDLHTKYEEAINFGDLEIVKQLYYLMKHADIELFKKINEIKV